MNISEIKRKRAETLLIEVVPQAFALLDDEQLKNLIVTDVICSRGRYDAKVFLDKSDFSKQEQEKILKKLHKVRGFLKNYIKESQGWYKAPNLRFEFDDHLEKIAKIDELFKQIQKGKKSGS